MEEVMAQFHVGQRVRVVAVEPDCGPLSRKALGECGRISGIGATSASLESMDYSVSLDKLGDGYCFNSCHLTPLTDPGADAFLARIKRIAREPINDAPKVEAVK
jgi:hypothetical protein